MEAKTAEASSVVAPAVGVPAETGVGDTMGVPADGPVVATRGTTLARNDSCLTETKAPAMTATPTAARTVKASMPLRDRFRGVSGTRSTWVEPDWSPAAKRRVPHFPQNWAAARVGVPHRGQDPSAGKPSFTAVVRQGWAVVPQRFPRLQMFELITQSQCLANLTPGDEIVNRGRPGQVPRTAHRRQPPNH